MTFTPVLRTDQEGLNHEKFSLGEPYPNPYNHKVNFQLTVNKKTELKAYVYGINGNLVCKTDYGVLDIGSHRLEWNGLNEIGNRVESGVYFFKIQGNGFDQTRKLLLLK